MSSNIKYKSKINTSYNNNIMNHEFIKNILLIFYPKEDSNFFNFIFSPLNESSFFKELEKFYKNIQNFSDEDPENKFYGVQNFTKIPKNRNGIEEIELNKLNTDLIFVLVKEILLSSYEEEIDKKELIKSKLNEIFNCNNLNSISFISNKLENYTSLFPINFYAFCVSIKILIICYPNQIKNFHIGIFLESEQTLFNEKNNECFLSELFCCYMAFLFFTSNILKNEIATLCFHFWNDSNIFENFTFHMTNNGYDLLKKELPEREEYEIFNLIKEMISDILVRISIYIHYNISINIYKKIVDFLNFGEYQRNINIFCDKKLLNNKNINLFKDFNNCKKLYVHMITNNSLLNSTIENKINLKDEENITLKNFSIEGKNLYIENLPSKMDKLNSLELISNKISYFLESEKEYKKLNNNICFNFQKDFFNNLNYLEELTLKHITPEQFFTLVSCFNSRNCFGQSMIYKLYLEINYSHLKIPTNLNTDISKEEILKAIDSLIRKCKRISDIRKLDIILSNGNPQNNLILTKENGFYFISLVLELLKRCYHFTLKNFNNYYYPLNDTKPELKPKAIIPPRRRNFRAQNQENEEKKINEEFSLQDDVHNCRVISNLNKDLQVIYNGNEFNDILNIVDLKNVLPFLFVVKKNLVRLKPKTILINIVKYFDIRIKAPKQLAVCNFNN